MKFGDYVFETFVSFVRFVVNRPPEHDTISK